MYKSKSSIIALIGFGLIGVIAAVMPHTGFAQTSERNGAMQHDCLVRPCADAVARGRAAFNEPKSEESRWERTLVRRLSHAIGELPALSRVCQGAVRCAAGETEAQPKCGRSALPAGGRRRLPYQRRQCDRLLEPGGKRARARDDALALERQTHRYSHRSAHR